jgi:hypothetical protein
MISPGDYLPLTAPGGLALSGAYVSPLQDGMRHDPKWSERGYVLISLYSGAWRAGNGD